MQGYVVTQLGSRHVVTFPAYLSREVVMDGRAHDRCRHHVTDLRRTNRINGEDDRCDLSAAITPIIPRRACDLRFRLDQVPNEVGREILSPLSLFAVRSLRVSLS